MTCNAFLGGMEDKRQARSGGEKGSGNAIPDTGNPTEQARTDTESATNEVLEKQRAILESIQKQRDEYLSQQGGCSSFVL